LKRDARDIVEFELREDFVGGLEVEYFARSVVEGLLDCGELLAADLAEVHAFGQVLADQAVGVFIAAALPRAVGIAEEHVDLEPLGQRFVQRHLAALVVGQRFAQRFGHRLQAAGEALERGLGVAAGQIDQHDVAACTLDQGTHRRAVHSTFDEITLPVTGHRARGHLGRAQRDGGHVLEGVGSLGATAAGHAALVGLAQQRDQLSAKLSTRHGVDGAVDGLVRDAQRAVGVGVGAGFGHAAQSAANLLRRPVRREKIAHGTPARRVGIAAQLAARQACGASTLGTAALPSQRVIYRRRRLSLLAPREFAADGGMVNVQAPGDRARTVALGGQCGDLLAFGHGQLRVLGAHWRITLPDAGCRTSSWSRPDRKSKSRDITGDSGQAFPVPLICHKQDYLTEQDRLTGMGYLIAVGYSG